MDLRQIQESLEHNGRLLNSLIVDFEQCATAVAQAEVEYKRAVALSTVNLGAVKMTVDVRKAQVELDTIELFEVYRLTNVALSVVKEKIASTKARIELLRTLSATNRMDIL